MIKRIKNSQGQMLVESIFVVLLFILILVPVTLSLIHFACVKTIAQHHLYEFLICTQTLTEKNSCENELRRKLRGSCWNCKVQQFHHQYGKDFSVAELTISTWYSNRVKFHEKIKLPIH